MRNPDYIGLPATVSNDTGWCPEVFVGFVVDEPRNGLVGVRYVLEGILNGIFVNSRLVRFLQQEEWTVKNVRGAAATTRAEFDSACLWACDTVGQGFLGDDEILRRAKYARSLCERLWRWEILDRAATEGISLAMPPYSLHVAYLTKVLAQESR